MHPTYEQAAVPLQDPAAVRQVFREGFENGREVTGQGVVASYIPELAKADGSAFGICAWKKDGELLHFGDTATRFSIQSISKVINLAVALKFLGFREVFSHVLMEPTGDAFNSILKLDTVENRPFNPMINAGAIEVMSLLEPEFSFEELLDFARTICMDEEISLNENVYRSEAETGDRNRAIAWLLKS
ncbi:MAG: glutaminase, partial [Lachnospiraceae bacterium]|nr:glutaminase [Lachnospiraceae bacterium]